MSLTCIHLRIDTAGICASLHMPLSSLLSLTADGGTLLYAAQPGASTVLAADLAVALHLPADQRFLTGTSNRTSCRASADSANSPR